MKIFVLIFIFLLIHCRVDRPILIENKYIRVKCDIQEYNITNLCEDEKNYLDWAKSAYPEYPRFEDLNQKVLKKIADETEDIDKATSIFYQRILEHKNTKEFLQEISKLEKQVLKQKIDLGRKQVKLVLVPGMFFQDNPDVRARGGAIFDVAKELNLQVETAPIDHVGTVEENANILCNYLRTNTDGKKIIFVSPSKGSSDIKRSIQIYGKEKYYKDVIGWFSIAGILKGSYVIQKILESKINFLEARTYFFLKGYNWNALLSIRAEDPILNSEFEIPETMIAVSLVATPLYRHITERAKPFFLALVPYGSNDGFTLLYDSIIPNSYIYPAWRNDHYFSYGFQANTMKAFLLFILQKSGI